MVCVIWQWSVRGRCSQPGLDGWATRALPALQEPMDLGIPNTMKKGGQEVVWRWQLKAAIQPVNLLLLGWLYSSLVPYQSYLLITYQPILRIFDNFLVSVSFFCTSLRPGTGVLAEERGVTCSYCHCRRGLSSWQGVLFCPAGISTSVFLPAFLLVPLDTLKSLFWNLPTFLEIECQKILFCILFLQSWHQYF